MIAPAVATKSPPATGASLLDVRGVGITFGGLKAVADHVRGWLFPATKQDEPKRKEQAAAEGGGNGDAQQVESTNPRSELETPP